MLVIGSLSFDPRASRRHGLWWVSCLESVRWCAGRRLPFAGEHREKSQPGFLPTGNGAASCAAFLFGGFVDVLFYLQVRGCCVIQETI